MAPRLVAAFGLFLCSASFAQAPDAKLLAEIQKIKSVDAHSRLQLNAVEPLAAPPSRREPATLPLRLRGEGPEWTRAWKALYHINLADADTDETIALLQEAREKVRREKGAGFADSMLDVAGVELALVEGPPPPSAEGSPTGRFRFLPSVDIFLRPFSQDSADGLKPFFIAARTYTLPKTLDEFLKRIVTPGLERWLGGGAVGVDVAIAEHRPLNFDEVNAEVARAAYGRLVVAGELGASAADLKAFQDYTFRYIAREAGRLGLVVHIHTGMARGAGRDVGNGNPLLLEPMLNDPNTQKTRFVLVHGGFPFDKEAAPLLLRPNVWADTSLQDQVRSPTELAETLRWWFELAPEKVLFATDAWSNPAAAQLRWPELTVLGSETLRQALALALGKMVSEGLITRDRALQIAEGVLRDNALELHGLNEKSG
ncbi:MAG: amidohydrolase family protein [Myxococcaceae bacterium]